MVYVEAPAGWKGPGPAVFLAGGITGCPDWQAGAAARLADVAVAGRAVTVLNPRRADFPMGDPGAAPAQIEWEYVHLRLADVVLFWFPACESPQPIALYELGAHAALGRPVAVGVDAGYVRCDDVYHQMRLARPDVTVWGSLADTVTAARHLLDQVAATAPWATTSSLAGPAAGRVGGRS